MGQNKVKAYWKEHDFPDIQRIDEYSIGDSEKLLTPKGIQTTGNFAALLPLFKGAYHGGRNESFMYGFDLNYHAYDYDIVSAYATALAFVGQLDYDKGFILSSKVTPQELTEWIYSEALFNCSAAFTVDFKFPSDRMYPNLPVHLDKNLKIFPLSGRSCTNGLALRVALDNGCEITRVVNGSIIPFKKAPWVFYDEDKKDFGVRLDEQPEEVWNVGGSDLPRFKSEPIYDNFRPE